ncbi:MAG TPA: metallophosphoesterase [Propionibacteriaceae bacterium]|nr:metallophosphoesterase [Propionibacteriaceae bacterium]
MKRARSLALLPSVLVVGLIGAGCGQVPPASMSEPTAAPSTVEAVPTLAPSTAVPTLAPSPAVPSEGSSTTFAIIGDYGRDNDTAAAVAGRVDSWDPAFVISVGDGYYAKAGGKGTAKYDESTGAHYCRWLAGITTTGERCPTGLAQQNAFFPTMGNHDYTDARPSPDTYLTYFDLPGDGLVSSSGNERYYDYVRGPVHFFVLNSNGQETEGIGSTSSQAQWLQAQLTASTSAWNIVYDHHPPYSSDADHGSTQQLQWPFAEWGADAVISGHAHTYERIMRDGIVYFVNGLGGSPHDDFTTPVRGSVVRYNDGWGAQKVTATPAALTFEFFDVDGSLIDSHTLTAA